MTTPTGGARLHDLDAMRSVLMLLGVVLHAANPYRVDGHWLITDPTSHPAFNLLVQSIHQFRLPAFFVVAGYFAMLSLGRRGPAGFVRERSIRLLLPCVATFVVLNIPQMLFLAGHPPGVSDRLPQGFAATWWSGDAVGHLWFLIILALHCVLLGLGGRRASRLLQQPLPTRFLAIGAWALIAAAVAFHLVSVTILSVVGSPDGFFLGLFDLYDLLGYLPFFAIGLLLRTNETLLTWFRRPSYPDLIVGALALAGVAAAARQDGQFATAAGLIGRDVVTWTLVRICFAFFHHLTSRPSKTFRYLSEASYSIYLFHHIVVVLLASALVGAAFASGVKFLILVVVASAVSLAMHEFLVRRSPLLTLLFNGRAAKTTS